MKSLFSNWKKFKWLAISFNDQRKISIERCRLDFLFIYIYTGPYLTLFKTPRSLCQINLLTNQSAILINKKKMYKTVRKIYQQIKTVYCKKSTQLRRDEMNKSRLIESTQLKQKNTTSKCFRGEREN